MGTDTVQDVQSEPGRWPLLSAAWKQVESDPSTSVDQRDLDARLAAVVLEAAPCGSVAAVSLRASRALRPDQSTVLLASIPAGSAGPSLDVVHAVATGALIWGDRLDALDLLRRSDSDTPVIVAVSAELLMALGRGNHARSRLDAAHADHPMLRVAHARLALLTGELERALAAATAPSSASTGPSSYHRLEMMVIAGVAHHRLGQRDAAADLMTRVVHQSTLLGAWLPLASAPRDDLVEMAGSVPAVAEMLRAEPLASAPRIYPNELTLVTLTEREQAVLEKMADGLTPREIASASYVSTNTVKSQLQSLYRKLGASSRERAITTAVELSLLPTGSTPTARTEAYAWAETM